MSARAALMRRFFWFFHSSVWLAHSFVMVQADEHEARPPSVQDGRFGINLVALLALPSTEGGVKKKKPG